MSRHTAMIRGARCLSSGASTTARREATLSRIKSLSLPVVAAPMFIVSNPALVIAQCTSGVVGSFPALNARPQPELRAWLTEITDALAKHDADNPNSPAAPFAVNQIVHRSNNRLEEDMALCEEFEVPIIITSLGAQPAVNERVKAWGGITLHDVIDDRFARKAVEKGVDGLICVAAGAGGHAGLASPFAVVAETRKWWDGPLLLSGSIATGDAVLAARAVGADLAYVGSAFIATDEANAVSEYKEAIVECSSKDIVLSSLFTGVKGNYLKPSIVNSGLDPDNLPEGDVTKMNFGSGDTNPAKAWKDIWGCGHGCGAIEEVAPAAEVVARLKREYAAAKARL